VALYRQSLAKRLLARSPRLIAGIEAADIEIFVDNGFGATGKYERLLRASGRGSSTW
jgi:hypothetical protein